MDVVADARRIVVPVIVLGEFRLGIAQSRHQASYENWLRQWVAAVEILDVEEETTRHYAAIGLELKRKGRPIPTNDTWIAALARQHSMPVLSRDRHFDLVKGLKRIAW
jgi:predicted nucleic acid-binding protein